VYCGLGADSVADISEYVNLDTVATTGEVFSVTSLCYRSTLLKIDSAIDLANYGFNLVTSPEGPHCYNSTCVGPTDLRVQVSSVWYKCPPEGGTITNIDGFGGEIICANTSNVCNPNGGFDITWPEVYSINPTSGGPSTVITITGNNFQQTSSIQVYVEGPCTDVKVLDEGTTIIATIPGSSYFVGIADLAIFQRKQLVYVIDERGYTDQTYFTIEVQFDGTYISNLIAWMGNNPMWTLIVIAAIVLPAACIIYCCCKGFSKPKKPKKKDHTENPTDHYYDDHYGVDDYYDDYDHHENENHDDYYDYK